eukprot:SAG31_NODE_8462_length_1446_cov_2.138827_2_plen_185_part_01
MRTALIQQRKVAFHVVPGALAEPRPFAVDPWPPQPPRLSVLVHRHDGHVWFWGLLATRGHDLSARSLVVQPHNGRGLSADVPTAPVALADDRHDFLWHGLLPLEAQPTHQRVDLTQPFFPLDPRLEQTLADEDPLLIARPLLYVSTADCFLAPLLVIVLELTAIRSTATSTLVHLVLGEERICWR